jgi:hypothetical protein
MKITGGILLLLACSLHAQSPTAAIVGIIRDATGATVPGAGIKVRNVDTNIPRDAVSGSDGGFTVTNLEPGVYDVIVEKAGFQTWRETALELQVNQTARLELQLKVGSVSEAVEVTAHVPLLNTENSAKGDVIVTEEIREMPLDGRNFQDLALLVPGVLPNAQGDFGSFPVNGARSDNMNYLIDGISARRPEFGQTEVSPNLDAIQEFKMETAGYSAENGRLGGGVMSVVLKGGSNQLHGSTFEFLRNDKLDARNFFAANKNELRRNQFGAMLSGPVWLPRLYNGHDRTFFMFSWESYRNAAGNNQLSRVPTPLERQGDFSQSVDATGKVPAIKDPFSANAVFPGNVIPLSRFNPVSANILPYYPLPNRPGNQANNYLANVSSHSPWDSFLVKFDQRASAKDSFGVRYQHRNNRGEVPFDAGPLGLFGTLLNTNQHILGLNYTRVITPTLINEFRGGLYRTATHQPLMDGGTDYTSKLGIAGIATDPAVAGFPSINVTGLAILGDKIDRPWIQTTNNYSYSDTLTWVKGRHQFKFGGDLLRNQNFQPYYSNVRGTFAFTGFWTGQPLADFLLGALNSASRQSSPPQNYLFSTNAGAFAQDDFKITPRLTLNLGLRWEFLGHQSDKFGRTGGFVPSLGKVIIADDRGVSNLPQLLASMGMTSLVGVSRDYGLPQSLIHPRYHDLAPRFGLAWRPFGGNTTVLRGGYGIFNSQSANNGQTLNMSNVFPFALSQNVSRVANNPGALSFADPFKTAGAAAISVGGVDPHAPTQYLQSWNMIVEREIKRLGAVEIGYAGSKGTHLGYSSDINRNYFTLDMRLPNGSFPRPFPQINNAITYFQYGGNSIYNSGTITWRRRFTNGFFYRVNYVYAKSIDNSSTFAGGGNGGPRQIQDPRNLAAERGRSNFDVGHSFSMNFSYQLRWRYSQFGWLMRGWQVAGTGRAATGAPFTPINSSVNLSLGEAIRPDRLRKGTVPNPRRPRLHRHQSLDLQEHENPGARAASASLGSLQRIQPRELQPAQHGGEHGDRRDDYDGGNGKDDAGGRANRVLKAKSEQASTPEPRA